MPAASPGGHGWIFPQPRNPDDRRPLWIQAPAGMAAARAAARRLRLQRQPTTFPDAIQRVWCAAGAGCDVASVIHAGLATP